ncbi:hypothetical protein HYE10_02295 [Mycoplasmopsis bovis]|nr:hypothetical protein HYE10_02295 [Mycoplasmopsis bovis]
MTKIILGSKWCAYIKLNERKFKLLIMYINVIARATNYWWNIWPSRNNEKAIKITLARWYLNEIDKKLIAGYDMKTVSKIVGFKSRSIFNLFDQNYNWNL